MWELDCEESWAPKNWCFGTVVLEKTLESPLDCKKIQPVHIKGDQSWVFIGRIDAEAEIPWPPHAKGWFIGKDPNDGRDWEQEEKGMTENEMAGWHHRLDGHEFKWIPGVDDGQGGLACCNLWGRKESDTAERLNWTELIQPYIFSSPLEVNGINLNLLVHSYRALNFVFLEDRLFSIFIFFNVLHSIIQHFHWIFPILK